MNIQTFAAIDIGSFELTMKIYEFSGKNHMREVDYISRRLDLGTDTYSRGKISNDKMDELCRTLNEFRDIMKTYRVEEYHVCATSAIRETENITIVQDQIAQRTGMNIEVLSNSEQRFLDYKAVAARGEAFRRIIQEKTAILDIGGGSIQLSLFENEKLVSTQNLRLEVLRIYEFLNRYAQKSSQYENIIDEMAMAQLEIYKKLYLKDREIKNLIVIDDYISPIALRRARGDVSKTVISTEEFATILEQLKNKSFFTEESTPLIFISAVLINRIAELMEAKSIWMPGASLCDGMAYEYAEKMKMFQGEHDFEEDIIACAMNISKRYMGSRKRAETLENISITIFDAMKKIHGLKKRERLYLRLAAILHDCGKYISMVNIGETSYQIIMATEIIGLSHTEREIVANVVRFNHSPFVYYGQQTTRGLDRDAYMIVAKLTAILRLASGMDRSHKQKLSGLKGTLKDNQLLLTIDTQEDITLEKGFFEDREEFFKEVFSIKPVLKQYKELLADENLSAYT